jgi:hypothetical protein
MKLELSEEALLVEIMGALACHGCLTNRIAPRACRIVYPRAADKREAWLEVGFFIRAWQAQHPGVNAVLSC